MAISEQRKKELDAIIAQELERRRGAASAGQGLSGPAKSATASQPSGSWLQGVYRGFQNIGGMLGKAGQTIMSPVTRTAATALSAGRGAVNLATGRLEEEAKAQEREKGLPPEWRPVKTAKETIGVGMQLGSMIAASAASAGLTTMGASPTLASTMVGGAAGLAGGAGAGLESSVGKGALETAGNALWGGAKGGTAGLAGGFIAGKLAPSSAATQKKIDSYVGKVTQAKSQKDIAKAKTALTMLTDDEIAKIKSYEDMGTVIEDNLDLLRNAQDEFLTGQPDRFRLTDFDTVYGTGDDAVTANPLKTIFRHLRTLYESIEDGERLSQLNALERRSLEEGLTLAELNQLTRDYGKELSQKAFSKSGEALTSVSAKAEETARLGMKDAISSKIAGTDKTVYRDLDEAMSKWLTLKRLNRKAIEGVNGLSNRIVERTAPQKIGRALGIATDKVTFGTLKAYVHAAVFPSNVGLKWNNWLDLQKSLNDNLRTIEYLSRQPLNRVLSWIVSAGASALGKKK